MLDAGVDEKHVYRDVGVSMRHSHRQGRHAVERRLAKGNTLAVASIDPVGCKRLNIMAGIPDIIGVGIRIQSLSPSESSCAVYLDVDLGSPEALLADVLTGFCSWNTERELRYIWERAVDGLNWGPDADKRPSAPRVLTEERADAMWGLRRQGGSKWELAGLFRVRPGHGGPLPGEQRMNTAVEHGLESQNTLDRRPRPMPQVTPP